MIRQTRTLLYALTAFAAYVVSAPFLVAAMAALGQQCLYARFQTYCRYAEGASYDADPYMLTALAIGVILIVARLRFRSCPWYPLLMIFGSVALAAIAYDALLQRPLIQGDKIINDTFNTLRFAILASFLLVFLIARRMSFRWTGVIAAVSGSYIASAAVCGLFQTIGPHVIGATRLYLLFILYAFGGFSLHLMAVSVLFASGKLESTP